MKPYATTVEQRLIAKIRRDELRARGLCISAASHGPATNGVLCRRCRTVHSGNQPQEQRA